jgi:uncharacterized membrane protein YeaQ/YmgE (transglycosylase-associated protein family)
VIGYIVSLIIAGLVIGGLGRLVVPGRQPIGFLGTVSVGLVGSVLGALAGAALHAGLLITVVLEVVIAAVLVALISGRGRRRRTYV